MDSPRDEKESERVAALCMAQGAIYALTGAWGVVNRPTFEAVTGPKKDYWLVRTVGSMFCVVGGVLFAAGARRRVTPEIRALAIGTAAAVTAVDVWYVSRRRISPVYLLDAVLEAALLGMWARRGRPTAGSRPSEPAEERRSRPQAGPSRD